jgi:hypothetical protein
MKLLVALITVLASLSAQASEVVSDQGLEAKCADVANSHFHQIGCQSSTTQLTDIYVVDMSKPEASTVNNRVQVEYYGNKGEFVALTLGEVTPTNPIGSCQIVLRSNSGFCK